MRGNNENSITAVMKRAQTENRVAEPDEDRIGKNDEKAERKRRS